MVVHLEAESRPGLREYHKFEASLGYIMRPYFKKAQGLGA
jgi:hypothetical protein